MVTRFREICIFSWSTFVLHHLTSVKFNLIICITYTYKSMDIQIVWTNVSDNTEHVGIKKHAEF